MRSIQLIRACLLITMLTSACSSAAQTLQPAAQIPTKPLPTAPLQTHTPPATPLPATSPPTAAPTTAPTPTITPLTLPSAAPLSEWNGIPIPPEAIAGQEVEQGYLFTTPVAVRKVQRYYSDRLEALAWEVQATGTKEGALLIAHKDGAILSIAISLHVSGVTLVRISLEKGE